MKSILDPTFKYVKSADTDIRKTFAKARAAIKKATAPPDEPPHRCPDCRSMAFTATVDGMWNCDNCKRRYPQTPMKLLSGPRKQA